MAESTIQPAKKLSRITRFSYGVGHVFNDLAASMWFSYLLVYLHQVRNFNNKLAGDLMLIGQVSDALATPFIGYESDRTKGVCKMGQRKSWHFIGTVCVLCSFPFLFVGCITCNHSADWAQFIYYIPFVVIFQFGWASTQISHLSLIPDLTPCENERVGLNGLRYAFTVLSNLFVYACAWLLFALGSKGMVDKSSLGSEDAPKFRNLVFIVLGTGLLFSFIFHFGTKEKPKNSDPDVVRGEDVCETSGSSSSSASAPVSKMRVRDWLKEPQFYMIGVLYMCTRLYVNLSQVYLPMYLLETLQLDKTNIAIAPLVVYVSGFATSLVMRPLNKLIGRKLTYIIGVGFAVAACVWLYFVYPSNAKLVYGATVFMGIGGSTMLVTSLAMTADLINSNTESGAFVYGAMSFTDKLSNGIAIEIIQLFHPCVNCCPACEPYYRSVQSEVPGVCAVIGLIMLLILLPQKIGTRYRDRNKAEMSNGKVPVFDDLDEKSPLLRNSANNVRSVTPVLDTRIHTSMNTPPADIERLT